MPSLCNRHSVPICAIKLFQNGRILVWSELRGQILVRMYVVSLVAIHGIANKVPIKPKWMKWMSPSMKVLKHIGIAPFVAKLWLVVEITFTRVWNQLSFADKSWFQAGMKVDFNYNFNIYQAQSIKGCLHQVKSVSKSVKDKTMAT